MRNLVTFQKGTETADDYGQPVTTWADFATRKARVTPLRGSERVQALQLNATLTHKVFVWRDSKTRLLEADLYRIKFGKRPNGTTDRILDINAIMNIREQNRELELHCTEAV